MTVSIHLKKIRSEEHLPKAFKHFDKNGSGYIEIDELREALGGDELDANEQVILDIISDVDKDKVTSTSYLSILFVRYIYSIRIKPIQSWA